MEPRPVSEVYTPTNTNILQDEPISEHYEKWGYSIGYVLDAEQNPVPEGGNTAVFRIHPQGMTEPLFVVKPEAFAAFDVSVIKGEGVLIKSMSNGEVQLLPLEKSRGFTIWPGDAYVYKNTSNTEDLILHDIAWPAFKPGDDIELTVSETYHKPTGDAKGYSLCKLKHLGVI